MNVETAQESLRTLSLASGCSITPRSVQGCDQFPDEMLDRDVFAQGDGNDVLVLIHSTDAKTLKILCRQIKSLFTEVFCFCESEGQHSVTLRFAETPRKEEEDTDADPVSDGDTETTGEGDSDAAVDA